MRAQVIVMEEFPVPWGSAEENRFQGFDILLWIQPRNEEKSLHHFVYRVSNGKAELKQEQLRVSPACPEELVTLGAADEIRDIGRSSEL